MSELKQALILIDIQNAFDDASWGERNNLEAEENAGRILRKWRELNRLVIHIRHISEKTESLFHQSKESSHTKGIVKPIEDEVIFEKKVNSSFIGTNLESYLHENEVKSVVIVGLTTPHCVSTTARMSGNLGFDTYLVSDATAAFAIQDQDGVYYDAETIHQTSLATLHREFATVLTTKQLLKGL
ncbi:cysteine hydrolase [Radiobacillus kanasensis]|uniref:cysteine hydrolase family protein n=1 Tax=Radiobacillus kanasensis TaxID=2844358 RepID=UPI001E4988E9|nr:cysteine hydrolase family protein [Radiobacillus kanasensis]UFU00657.1 cysteine hydrolase [Radiobacillus kanasensis]